MKTLSIMIMVVSLLAAAGCSGKKSTVSIHDLEVVNGQTVSEWAETLEGKPEPPQAFHTTDNGWTGWNKFWFASAIGGQAADVVSTEHALDSGDCSEANPILGDDPSTGAVVALKVAIVGAAVWFTEYALDGHDSQQRARNWVYGSLAAFGFGAAAWNSSQDCQ